jgi:putative membrane protein
MYRGFGGHGMGVSNYMGFEGMLFVMGFKLLIFVALIAIGYKLYKNYTNKSNQALKIISEKFANGEISEEEYIKRKTVLSQKK